MVDITLKIPAIEKLIDYAASGVGAIAGPMLAPWRASREGKARLIAAEADAGVRQIEAHSDADALTIIAEAQTEARGYVLPPEHDAHTKLDINRDNIAQAIEFQTRKRLANTKSVLEGAAEELGDKEVPDHEPDPDWTARFFDCVQDVSSEDMQKLWSKILAGEVESPGRTSLRTLDTLKNMSRRDAELFRDFCDFVIGDSFVFYHESLKGIVGLNFNNMLHLQDCGLVNVGPNLVKMLHFQGEKQSVIRHHNYVLVIAKNRGARGDTLDVPEVLLTTTGKELFQFVQGRLHLEYLRAFSRFLKSKKCKLRYTELAEDLGNGKLLVRNPNLIEP